MNDIVLRAKHWQVFLFLLAPHFASWYVTDETTDAVLSLLSIFFLIAWLALQGVALDNSFTIPAGYNTEKFLINSAVVLIACGYSAIVEDPQFYVSISSWHASGIKFWPFLYVVYAYLHVHWFPASLAIATETGHQPNARQGLIRFLLYFFWPIGVWFVQPRLNKLWQEKQWERSALQKIGANE
jgi:glucose-6-phosphate-specific signal transduction histidine kinase